MTSSVHVFAAFAPPTVAIAPPWAPPLVVVRAAWPAPHLWPAPRVWAPPELTRATWPAPVPRSTPTHHRSRSATSANATDIPARASTRSVAGRSLAYTIAGVAAAAVGFAVVAIR